MINIGKRLKEYRNSWGLPQDKFAEKIGLSAKKYQRIESGRQVPNCIDLAKMCNDMGTSTAEFYMHRSKSFSSYFSTGLKIRQLMCNGLKGDIDIHYNKQIIHPDCDNVLWYNGYIGSAYLDEFEVKMIAAGNIRGTLFLNFEPIMEINSCDIYQDLQPYIHNDKELKSLIQREEVDEAILSIKKGNALFLTESNWLALQIVNNDLNWLSEPIEIENDDIYTPFEDYDNIIDFILSNSE